MKGASQRVQSVSILIPTHNRGAILDQTLVSIEQMQRPEDVRVEVVVVANACTDDTLARLERWKCRWPLNRGVMLELKVVSEPQIGLQHARNRAVQEASHDVLAFLDDDVFLDAQWLMGLLSVYRSTEAELVAGRICLWFKDVERPSWFRPYHDLLLSCLDRGADTRKLKNAEAVGANFSFRRHVFDRFGPFTPALDRQGSQMLAGGETHFVRKAIKHGAVLYYEPRMFVRHWVAPGRVEPAYLYRAARGLACTNVLLAETLSLPFAIRTLVLGAGRVLVHGACSEGARILGRTGLHIHHQTRCAVGLGQLDGLKLRHERGPLP